MHFKVLTLDIPAFRITCGRLQSLITDSGYTPEIIVGIPRGGIFVSDNLFDNCDKTSLELVRPVKGRLKTCLGRVIKHFPLWLRDELRIMEAKLLVRKSSHMANTMIFLPKIPLEVSRVLVVDDAVDSGATLKAVMEKYTGEYPDKDIRSAVLTITGRTPVYKPDYYLYDDGTLIRTPWSIDTMT